jgi:hypothetical protein
LGGKKNDQKRGMGVGLIDNLVDRAAFVLNFALEEAR